MFVPVHAHDHCSILDGSQSAKSMIDYCIEQEYPAYAITNHGNCFSAYEHNNLAKKAGIKSILGNELYLSSQSSKIKNPLNRKLSHLPVLSRSLKGWRELIKIVSASNHPDNFYYKPRLSLDELAEMPHGDIIAFSGHAGSDLANACITDLSAYRADSLSEARSFLRDVNDVIPLALKYKEIFPEFFLEIQLIDEENLPVCRLIAEMLREVSKKTGIPCLATADSHYTRKEDAHIQRILLCSSLRTTLRTVYNKLNNEEEFGLGGFFKSNNYHIPTLKEMQSKHTEEEIKNTLLIADMCENYSLQKPPSLPSLYENDNQVLSEMCWGSSRMKSDPVYQDRLRMELGVIVKNKLSGYFLIMQDIVRWAQSQNILCGVGRGSAGGCLVSYLIDITKIDPIPYGLLFERFYNEGRNTEGQISLPDIDVDFDRTRREEVISYIENKYGKDKVGHIMTISTLQGRGALKEVFRVYDACSQTEMNTITSNIPQEAEISDHLEEMRKAKGYSSIIEWTLENEPKSIETWAKLENGKIVGEYSKYFELAIKIEGAKKNVGQHASGIVVSNEPLTEITPMVNQGGNLICGMEMGDLDKMGLAKLDILGLSTLSKIDTTLQLIKEIK